MGDQHAGAEGATFDQELLSWLGDRIAVRRLSFNAIAARTGDGIQDSVRSKAGRKIENVGFY